MRTDFVATWDIRQRFDHMDNRQVIRWLVRGFARELCHLKARARIADADWTPEFDFSKGGKTGGIDTPALLNELMQHHLSQLAEQWHREKTGYVIGSRGDDQEMNRTVLSHLCWVDNIWLFAHDTTMLQAMIDDLMHSLDMHRRKRNTVTARAPEGHRLRFDPCGSMKVLGSWCDDKGGSTGALVASIQTGNSAFYKHEIVLKVENCPLRGG